MRPAISYEPGGMSITKRPERRRPSFLTDHAAVVVEDKHDAANRALRMMSAFRVPWIRPVG